jgi:hypothetical protein
MEGRLNFLNVQITVDKIEKRVDRYEQKAILKAKYGSQASILGQPENGNASERVSVPSSPGLTILYPSSLPNQRTLFSPFTIRNPMIPEEDGDSSSASDDESNQRHRRRQRRTVDSERESLL